MLAQDPHRGLRGSNVPKQRDNRGLDAGNCAARCTFGAQRIRQALRVRRCIEEKTAGLAE
jgi:hypothetical protein